MTTRDIISGGLILGLLVSIIRDLHGGSESMGQRDEYGNKRAVHSGGTVDRRRVGRRAELEMAKVDGNYRHNKAAYSIKGPTEWKHSATGQTHAVYERINPQKGGAKWQLFVINEERTGLGRLYDGRPNQDTRTSSGGLKFPLGLWKEGETRKHVYKIYEGSRDSERVESITIKQIDFTLGNDPHCLEFYWSVTDKSEKKRYDHHTYTYCPGKSMVHEIQH